jgi:hypothetical protein
MRWFPVLMLCCIGLPWFNAVRIAAKVAHIKTHQRRAGHNRTQEENETLILDLAFEKEIKATGEFRVNGCAYDVSSCERLGGKLRVVAHRDQDETKMETLAEKNTEQRNRLQSVALAIPMFSEEPPYHILSERWFCLTLSCFRTPRCKSDECVPVLAWPPEFVAC